MNTLFTPALAQMRAQFDSLMNTAGLYEIEIVKLRSEGDAILAKIGEHEAARSEVLAIAVGLERGIKVLQAEAEHSPEPSRKPRLDITQAVADYLARQDGPRSVAGIARAVGRKPSQVKAALSRLMLTGRAVMLATDEGEKWRAPTTLAVAAE